MLACLFGVLAQLSPLPATAAERPLAVRNLSPVSQMYGLPRMLGGQRCCEQTKVTFRAAQASNFTSANIGNTQVFFDGETTVVDYAVSSNWGSRAEWGIAVPLVMHSGGFLDGFLDGFHDLFGLPEGGRERARRDQLDYLVRVNGQVFAGFGSEQKGFGDARAWLGYQLHHSQDRSLMLRGQIKAPSGRVKRLTGSEALDVAAWAELEERGLLSGLGAVITVGVGAVWLGDGDLSPGTQESVAAVGHIGLQRRFGKHVSLLAQLDGHSKLHEGAVDALGGAALMGSVGLRAQVTPRFSFELGLVEDLESRSTSDVVFQLQLDAHL